MAPRLLRPPALLVGIAALVAGCELLVELDRSAADAGGDAGCPICSDAPVDEDVDAQAPDASPPDTGRPATDARPEGAADSAARGGG